MIRNSGRNLALFQTKIVLTDELTYTPRRAMASLDALFEHSYRIVEASGS